MVKRANVGFTAESVATSTDQMLCADCGASASIKFDGAWRCRLHYSRYRSITDIPLSRKDRRAEITAIVAMLTNKRPSKQWAYDLKAREDRGEKLTATQSRFWREALHADLVAVDRVPGEDDEEIKR
jgi:hypothetical protein